MDSLFTTIYQKLALVLDLSQAKQEGYKLKLSHENMTVEVETIETKPEYFSILRLLEYGQQTDGLDAYSEMTVRVWNHGIAEVLSVRQAHFGVDQEVYIKRHGLEIANPVVKEDSNRTLLNWLDALPKDVHFQTTA